VLAEEAVHVGLGPQDGDQWVGAAGQVAHLDEPDARRDRDGLRAPP
jgi:hypothetical protein